MENKKVFSKYVMSFENDFEGNKITNLLDSNGKETLFSYTFYTRNKDYLDDFTNILEYVKPKKEMIKKNNIIVNLDNYSVSYSSNSDKVNENDLKQVMKIIKNEMSEANPEIAKQKALLIKYANDIKTLEDLQSDDFDFTIEIEEIKEKIEEAKEKIDEILDLQQ